MSRNIQIKQVKYQKIEKICDVYELISIVLKRTRSHD